MQESSIVGEYINLTAFNATKRDYFDRGEKIVYEAQIADDGNVVAGIRVKNLGADAYISMLKTVSHVK